MVRRLGTFTAVIVALPIWFISAPIWVSISLLADLAGRLFRFPTIRLGLAVGIYLMHEWVGMTAAGWLWLTGRFGRNLNLDAHRRVQGWWASSLLRWADRLLGVRLELDDLDEFPEDRFIVLSRHASMADAVIPARLIAGDLDRFVHYVLKRELRLDPNLDLFGTRLGNYFVERGADTDREAAAIRALAERALPGSALVIFPEGTYATPTTRRRVLASLERKGDPQLLARAQALEALLPAKPAGTEAMLAGRPDADVVILGHVGLEGVANVRGLRRRLPLRHPVVVQWWLHRRSELPSESGKYADWLNDRWDELDRWVVSTRAQLAARDEPTR